MPTFETLLLVTVVLGGLVAVVFVLVALRGRGSRATSSLDRGRFEEALELGGAVGTGRDERLAAAVAARHLERFEEARRLLEEILVADPSDGEAWLELGLVETYAGRFASARRAFDRVSASRSDLLEPLTLHRAWLALEEGDHAAARRHFDDIEVPLENKLRQDIGPGDAIFAEWFLEAGHLWRERGDEERASWALEAARRAAPRSRLVTGRAH